MEPITVHRLRGLIVFTIVVFLGLSNLDTILSALNKFLSVISPFLIGAGIAFLLNLPMSFLERQFETRIKNETLRAWKRPLCLLISILFILLILALIAMILFPRLVESVVMVLNILPGSFREISRLLGGFPPLQAMFDKFMSQWPDMNFTDIGQHLIGFLQSGSGNIAGTTFSFIGGVFGTVLNFVLGFFFAVYVLGTKETLARQATILLYAFLPERIADYILHVGKISYRSFHNFLTGVCMEVLVQSALVITMMTIFRFPFALVIGIITGFLAFIPYFGAYIGAVIGFLIILTVDVRQAFAFLLFISILQQIEGNVIYPRIVGKKVGLTPLWTLIAVTLGGSLFGFVGLLIFVPLTSVIYQLVREQAMVRIVDKQVDIMEKRENIV